MNYIPNIPYHHAGELCPVCRSKDWRKKEFIGKLKVRKGKFGDFLGCSRYPDCKYTQNMKTQGKKPT